MNDLLSGSLRSPTNAEVGDNRNYDRKALKGYVSESKLKRIVKINANDIKVYLASKFNIPGKLVVKLEGIKDADGKSVYEEFDIIDMITMRLSDFNSKRCIKLLEIYEDKGLHSLINAIQYLSPIQKI